MRIKILKNNWLYFIFGLAYAVVTFILIGCEFNLSGDYTSHYGMIVNVKNDVEHYSPNFLYYFLARWLSVISPSFPYFNLDHLGVAMVFIVSLAHFLKFYFTVLTVKYFLNERNDLKKSKTFISLISLSLVILFSIPSYNLYIGRNLYYLGHLVPMVWHNSTIIVSTPLSILLFLLSYKQLSEYKMNRNYIISLLSVLTLLIKPSFILVYIVVYPLIYFFKYKLSKKYLWGYAPVVFSVLFLVVQYVMIYVYNIGSIQSEKSKVGFGFLTVWGEFVGVKNIPIVIFTSLMFPLMCLFVFPKWLIKRDVLFSFSLLLVSVLIFAYLYEIGPRMYHGNFFWQIVPSVYIFFMVSIIQLIIKAEELKNRRFYLRLTVYFLSFIYILHICSGIFYAYRYITQNIYS